MDGPDDEQHTLTVGQQVKLSCWRRKHYLNNSVFDELANQEALQKPGWFARRKKDHWDGVLGLDQAWAEGHRERVPSVEDRMLSFLRTMICKADAGEPRPETEYLLMAAGECSRNVDFVEMQWHAVEQGWTGGRYSQCPDTSPYRISFSAYIYVEVQIHKRDGDQLAA